MVGNNSASVGRRMDQGLRGYDVENSGLPTALTASIRILDRRLGWEHYNRLGYVPLRRGYIHENAARRSNTPGSMTTAHLYLGSAGQA